VAGGDLVDAGLGIDVPAIESDRDSGEGGEVPRAKGGQRGLAGGAAANHSAAPPPISSPITISADIVRPQQHAADRDGSTTPRAAPRSADAAAAGHAAARARCRAQR